MESMSTLLHGMVSYGVVWSVFYGMYGRHGVAMHGMAWHDMLCYVMVW